VRPHAVKQGLTKILGRIAQCGFEVVAIRKVQVQVDQLEELGACKAPDIQRQGMIPMIREMWSKDLLDSECVVMVVKRVNAVYQMHILAGHDQTEYTRQDHDFSYIRHHATIGQASHEGGYWQHNRSVIKNGPSLRSLAGSSLIQNAVWVPDSYDEAMEEIKRFFPYGLPADLGHHPILVSENFPSGPACDTEIAINLRKIYHVHKGTRLYPEIPDRQGSSNSDRYMGSLGAFSTSFTSVNTTAIAIIILDQEMLKVQELIDVDIDSIEGADALAREAESEEHIQLESADENEQNFADDDDTTSDNDGADAPGTSRHRYFTSNKLSTSSGSSLDDHNPAPALRIRDASQEVSSSEQLMTEENEDSDVDVETTTLDQTSAAQRLKEIKEKKKKKRGLEATTSCATQSQSEPTMASAISEKTLRLNNRLQTNMPQSLLNATKHVKASSSSPCYSSSSSGSNSVSANYAASRLPPPIMPEATSSQQNKPGTAANAAENGSGRGDSGSDRAPLVRPTSQAATASATTSSSRLTSQDHSVPLKKSKSLPSYLDTANPAYINVLKALMQASYRIIGMRRTWLRDDQAANLFGINYVDFMNFDPTGVEESINFEWAQKLSSGPSLVLAVQRHGACYALLDSTLENFQEFDQHIFKTRNRQQALHFTASMFSRLPKDAVWKIEHDPC